MHWTLKQETASPPAGSLRRQQECFDTFREEYNRERPHEALKMSTPAEHYQPSERPYPRQLPEPEYAGCEVRLVYDGGNFRFGSKKVFVSHALAGEKIGLEPLRLDGERYWKVRFMKHELGVLDQSRSKLWTPTQWDKRQVEGKDDR